MSNIFIVKDTSCIHYILKNAKSFVLGQIPMSTDQLLKGANFSIKIPLASFHKDVDIVPSFRAVYELNNVRVVDLLTYYHF